MKNLPSWRQIEKDGTDASLKDCSTSSVLRIHRGAACIVEDVANTEGLTWEAKLDLKYAIERMCACMSEIHSRTGKQPKPSKSQAGKAKAKKCGGEKRTVKRRTKKVTRKK